MLFVFISLPKLPFEDGLEPKGNDDQQEPKPFHRLAAPACLIHEKKAVGSATNSISTLPQISIF